MKELSCLSFDREPGLRSAVYSALASTDSELNNDTAHVYRGGDENDRGTTTVTTSTTTDTSTTTTTKVDVFAS